MKLFEKMKSRVKTSVTKEINSHVINELVPIVITGVGGLYTMYSIMSKPRAASTVYTTNITYNVTNYNYGHNLNGEKMKK